MKERRLGFELHRASRMVKRYMDGDATRLYVEKMTGTHGWAVGYFYDNRHRDVFQKDFEQEFDIRRSTASNILSLMEKNGLINRESVPYDARLKKITLTDKALEVQSVVNKSFDRLEGTMKKNISDEELRVFFSVLDKVCNNLERNDYGND
ncbi:MAG: winged helix-turn-helix transcriptional regulator [Clostridia bacterium]|nr:winged helix-turn-helix transcriptional regulator [Clostridia bacterium]